MYRIVRLGQIGLYRGHPKRDQNSCDCYKPLFMKRLKSQTSIQPMAMGDQVEDEKFHVAGLSIENRKMRVPLDYDGVTNAEIDIFYRIVTNRTKTCQALPFLVYIQGGPGFEGPRPMSSSGWIKAAVKHYQVILLDQRGTGLSHGITCDVLCRKGSPEDQARFLTYFRADSIIKDCEMVRKEVVKGTDQRWSILGQSFGGFCCMTYLSLYPSSLAEVFLTGGVPPGIGLPCSAELVYRQTFQKVMRQNEKFYQRFPEAVQRVQDVVLHLSAQPGGGIETPCGNLLTPRSLQLLGLSCMGFSNGFERLNYMFEGAFDVDGHISYRFLKEFDTMMPWDSNVLYAILHESIYCQGAASQWAAHRIRTQEFQEDFDAVALASAGKPVYFTGEMVFPWMFDEFKQLRKVKEAAEILANWESWPALYSLNDLSTNTVPVAAACYFEDIFVSFELTQETLDKVGCVRQYVTNDYLHDGIRENGGAIFEKLLNIVRGGAVLR